MIKPDCDEQPGFFLYNVIENSNYLSMVASRSGPREMILIGTFR